MSKEFNEAFRGALLKFIQKVGCPEAARILRYEEDKLEWGGGCPTCAYTEIVVYIDWEDEERQTGGRYKYSGSFVDLINWLTDDDDDEEEDR